MDCSSAHSLAQLVVCARRSIAQSLNALNRSIAQSLNRSMPKLHPTAHHLLRLLTSSFCRPPTSFAPCPLSSLPFLLRLQLAHPVLPSPHPHPLCTLGPPLSHTSPPGLLAFLPLPVPSPLSTLPCLVGCSLLTQGACLLPACCLPAAHPLPALLCSTVALLLHAFVSVSCQCGFSVELIPTLPSSCLHLLSPACSLPCLSRRIVHCSACVTPVQ